MADVVKSLVFKQDDKLYDLYDLPEDFVIKGNLDLSKMSLTKLPDLSKVTVEGDFLCNRNKLTTLEGAPKKVGGNFSCASNQLTSLQGAPQEVGGNFDCFDNLLGTLYGISKEIGGSIIAEHHMFSMYGLEHFQTFSLDELKKSPFYREEIFINEKSKELRNKVMRTIAAENVSPQKGVVNPKRTIGEKKVIKQMLDSLGNGADR